MRKVFKYATGQDIPDGAVYLSTQVETVAFSEPRLHSRTGEPTGERIVTTQNKLVWHYFLVVGEL
jgi:hypothetical protein